MSENQKRILEMLAQGKISVDEAQRLLSLVREEGDSRNGAEKPPAGARMRPRFLYVNVEPKAGAANWRGRVNVRVPFGIIKSGMKLASLIPPEAAEKVDAAFKEKGMPFDFRKMKDEDIDDLVAALQDTEVNVETDEATVRVYADKGQA